MNLLAIIKIKILIIDIINNFKYLFHQSNLISFLHLHISHPYLLNSILTYYFNNTIKFLENIWRKVNLYLLLSSHNPSFSLYVWNRRSTDPSSNLYLSCHSPKISNTLFIPLMNFLLSSNFWIPFGAESTSSNTNHLFYSKKWISFAFR